MNSTPLVVWVLTEIKGGHRHGNHGCQWGSLAQSRMSLSGGTCLSQGQDAPAIQRRVFSLGSHVQRCLGEWRPHTFPSVTPVNFPGDTQSWVEASLWNHTPWSWGQASHVHPQSTLWPRSNSRKPTLLPRGCWLPAGAPPAAWGTQSSNV